MKWIDQSGDDTDEDQVFIKNLLSCIVTFFGINTGISIFAAHSALDLFAETLLKSEILKKECIWLTVSSQKLNIESTTHFIKLLCVPIFVIIFAVIFGIDLINALAIDGSVLFVVGFFAGEDVKSSATSAYSMIYDRRFRIGDALMFSGIWCDFQLCQSLQWLQIVLVNRYRVKDFTLRTITLIDDCDGIWYVQKSQRKGFCIQFFSFQGFSKFSCVFHTI